MDSQKEIPSSRELLVLQREHESAVRGIEYLDVPVLRAVQWLHRREYSFVNRNIHNKAEPRILRLGWRL